MAKKRKNVNDDLIYSPDILYRHSVDMLVVASALVFAGVYLNGLNALRTAFWSVLVSTVCETVACRITKRHDEKANVLYAAFTGLAVAIMLPATIPAYIVIIASAFSVLAVLVPFGSARKMPFVPAAAGICFVTVCFPKEVFAYAPINVGVSSPVYGSESFVAAESLTQMLSYGKSIILNPIQNISLLMGLNSGPMGTTCIIVLIAVGIYVIIKRKESAAIILSFFAACAAFAAVFPRVNSGAFSSVVLELSAGMLFFGGIVLLTDPFTSPQKLTGRIAYGISAGIICMLLRRYGAFEESVCFTVLLVNALAPATGDFFEGLLSYLKEKGIIKQKLPKFKEVKPSKKSKDSEKPKKEKTERAMLREEKKKIKKSEKEKKNSEKIKAENERIEQRSINKELAKKERIKKEREKREEEKKRNPNKNKPAVKIDHLSYEGLMDFDDDPIKELISDRYDSDKQEGESDNG